MTFTGTAGQRVQFQTSNSTYPGSASSAPWWQINGPTGSRVSGQYLNNALSDVVTLPTDGTYKVFIDPTGSSSGAIDVRGWTVPADLSMSYPLGADPLVAPTTLTTTSSQNAIVTFTATAGQIIDIQTTGASYGTGTMSWKILNPDNSTLAGSWSGNHDTGSITLSKSGTYRIVIDPSGLASGTVNLRAWTVSGP